MDVPNYVSRYRAELAHLVRTVGRDQAMDLIVGGQYEQIGILELSALISAGLEPNWSVIDVGCGSGRLAYAMRDYLKGSYLGTDILGEALIFAKEKVGRLDWNFIETYDAQIPAEPKSADVVCFFSVFTHLLDEDIFRFLSEAKRVLRPGGRIVFSYLDFEVPCHWSVFEQTLKDEREERVINKFISKPAILRWADALELKVERLIDGDQAWIQLIRDFRYSDGRNASGVVAFGQSVGILQAV